MEAGSAAPGSAGRLHCLTSVFAASSESAASAVHMIEALFTGAHEHMTASGPVSWRPARWASTCMPYPPQAAWSRQFQLDIPRPSRLIRQAMQPLTRTHACRHHARHCCKICSRGHHHSCLQTRGRAGSDSGGTVGLRDWLRHQQGCQVQGWGGPSSPGWPAAGLLPALGCLPAHL